MIKKNFEDFYPKQIEIQSFLAFLFFGLLGRKDVVLVKPQETVRFIAKFEDFANDTIPYMYHCHLLTHEDGGMMGQFIVTNVLSINENSIDDKFIIYPNPSEGLINIEFKINSVVDDIFIYDNLGRRINSTIIKNENSIRIEGLQNGVFYIKLIIGKDAVIKKVIAY